MGKPEAERGVWPVCVVLPVGVSEQGSVTRVTLQKEDGVESSPPGPQDVTSFGHRVLKEVSTLE